MTCGLLIVAVVICHNVLGYLLGYGIGKVLKLNTTKTGTASLTVAAPQCEPVTVTFSVTGKENTAWN